MSNPEPPALLRGLQWGLGYGVAVSTVHLTVGMILILALGMPPHTWFAVKAVAMEIALGGLIGVVATPLFLVGGYGRWLHPVVLALIWIGLERWVAVDPSKLQMWLAPPVAGLAVLGVGVALARRWPRPLAVGVLVLDLVLLSLPVIRHATTVEEEEALADRPDPTEGQPDVLFIVMDTVRAQSSSTYGYERQTTPVLTELANDGVRFADANAPATWSLPAHASLFTGTFPSFHNAHGETRYLDDKLPTIMERFQQAGYETRCFSANPHISNSFGLTRGFDSCDKAWSTGSGGRQFTFMYRLLDQVGLGGVDDKGGSMVVGNIGEWMAERTADDRPAFVFVNFLEAHFPFHQLPKDYLYAFHDRAIGDLRAAGQIAFGAQFGRPLTDAEIEQIRGPIVDMYDGGVKYTDALVGQVIDVWRQRGTLDETVVVVLADHGEVVGEHGAFGHVSAVVEEDLRVPMVFRYPPKLPRGEVVDEPVSTAGVFATLVELAGIEADKSWQVDSLLTALQDTGPCAALPEAAEVPEGDGPDATLVTVNPRANCIAQATATVEATGKPILAERFEEHMLADRFAPGTANGKGPLVNPRGRYRTYRTGPYKLVEHSEDGAFLFILDMGEDTDIGPQQEATLNALRKELLDVAVGLGLPALGAEVVAVENPDMTAEERCSLCALGYLDGEACKDCP